MRLKEINVSGFIKSVLFFSLLFISCKEYPILHQFESETDVPISEYSNNFENKVFYAYSTEKYAYIIDNVDKNIPINFRRDLDIGNYLMEKEPQFFQRILFKKFMASYFLMDNLRQEDSLSLNSILMEK